MRKPKDYLIKPDPLDPRLTERVTGIDQAGAGADREHTGLAQQARGRVFVGVQTVEQCADGPFDIRSSARHAFGADGRGGQQGLQRGGGAHAVLRLIHAPSGPRAASGHKA